jgi:hypothetical protein
MISRPPKLIFVNSAPVFYPQPLRYSIVFRQEFLKNTT